MGLVALQAGVLAGGVVFVPMAMAGWHLNRNRVLFFSAPLFIVLAVSMHLVYLRHTSFVLHSIHSPWPFMAIASDLPREGNTTDCLAHLHDVVWKETLPSQHRMPPSNLSKSMDWFWTDDALEVCRFQRLQPHDAVELFRGSWIVFAGDSQLRLLFISLLDTLLGDANPVRVHSMKRHADYEYVWNEESMRFQFRWAPFSRNLTGLLNEYEQNGTYPDVLIMGAGLWHMLSFANSSQYAESLVKLQRATLSLLSTSLNSKSVSFEFVDTWARATPQLPHMFWLNMPTLIPSLLNTDRKRERMTAVECELYSRALMQSKLVRPTGPLTLLDLRNMTSKCASRCTIDGMHYSSQMYVAIVHAMINALLIATNQSPNF